MQRHMEVWISVQGVHYVTMSYHVHYVHLLSSPMILLNFFTFFRKNIVVAQPTRALPPLKGFQHFRTGICGRCVLEVRQELNSQRNQVQAATEARRKSVTS